MKNNTQGNTRSRASRPVSQVAAAILAIGVAAAPAMYAQPKPKKAASTTVGVIAHVPLDGGSATRLLLVRKNAKQYLYAGLTSSSNVCIFDVTTPGDPHKVERFDGAAGTQTADFQMAGDALAVSTRTGDAATTASEAAPRSVTILNVKDPKNPQSVQTFAGVTSVVVDSDHGVIYLSNDEGLWVIQGRQPEKFAPVDNYGS